MVASDIRKWPSRNDATNRLEPICAPGITPRFHFPKATRVFTIGSCFARNIEEYLGRIGMFVPTLDFTAPRSEFPVAERPTGLLNKYTPHTILNEIRFAFDPDYELEIDDHFVDVGDGTVLDLHLPTRATVCVERARARRLEIRQLFRQIAECELIVVTLGLVEAWYDAEKQTFIAQRPPAFVYERMRERFIPHRLNFEESRRAVRECVERILNLGSEKRILMTTSPVPLARTFRDEDVIVANMYSKSVLRCVAEEIKEEFAAVDYFPSYETVMLSERARTWVNDQRHVRDEVVGQIVQRVCDAYFSPRAQDGSRVAYAAARQALSAGRHDEAAARLEALAPVLGADKQFLIDLATAHLRRGAPEAAIEPLTKTLRLTPDAARLHLLLARACWRAKRPDEAYEAACRATTLDRGDARAAVLQGKIEIRLGKAPGALPTLRAVADAKPALLGRKGLEVLEELARMSNDESAAELARRQMARLSCKDD